MTPAAALHLWCPAPLAPMAELLLAPAGPVQVQDWPAPGAGDAAGDFAGDFAGPGPAIAALLAADPGARVLAIWPAPGADLAAGLLAGLGPLAAMDRRAAVLAALADLQRGAPGRLMLTPAAALAADPAAWQATVLAHLGRAAPAGTAPAALLPGLVEAAADLAAAALMAALPALDTLERRTAALSLLPPAAPQDSPQDTPGPFAALADAEAAIQADGDRALRQACARSEAQLAAERHRQDRLDAALAQARGRIATLETELAAAGQAATDAAADAATAREAATQAAAEAAAEAASEAAARMQAALEARLEARLAAAQASAAAAEAATKAAAEAAARVQAALEARLAEAQARAARAEAACLSETARAEALAQALEAADTAARVQAGLAAAQAAHAAATGAQAGAALAALAAELAARDDLGIAQARALVQAREEIAALRASHSWAVTAPLRGIGLAARRLRRGGGR